MSERRWTHPNHGTPKSPSLVGRGAALTDKKIDQYIREGKYSEKLRLALKFKDSLKKHKPKVTRKVFTVLGADDL